MWVKKYIETMQGQKNKIPGFILFSAGLMLIAAGFFIFIPVENHSNVFWLDLLIVCTLYIFNTFIYSGIFVSIEVFNKKIAGFGIRVFFIPTLNLIAIIGMIIAWHKHIEFKYQLFFQLLLLFAFFSLFLISRYANQHIVDIQLGENEVRSGIENLRSAVQLLEISVGSHPDVDFPKNQLDNLIEKIRYLSPSNNTTAKNLEEQIIVQIGQLKGILDQQTPEQNKITELLRSCDNLVSNRKKFFTN